MPSKTLLFNWYASCVAAACMVLYGYDASVFNSVQGSKHWVAWFDNPSASAIGGVNTAYTVGAIVGGWFMGGPISDFFGRKAGMGAGCFLVVIATFIQTFAPKGALSAFIVGRCMIGVGQGIALTSGPIYIGEIAPAHIRGRIMTFWQTFYSVGSFICFWIAYATGKHTKSLGEWDWKLVVIFQLLVPVMILILLFTIPGTPRWYVKRHGDLDKARETLLKLRDTEQEAQNELLEIREALEYEKEAISSNYSALWKDRSIRKRLAIAFVINGGQQVTGQGSLNSYSTKIYQKVFKSASTINLINALNATFGILFTLNAIWMIDRFGRRFLLIVGAVGMSVAMIIVATVETQTPSEGGSKSESVGIATVFLLFLFILFYKPSWGATVWIWTSEVFSMNVRAQAVGMASQTQNIVNAIVNQFFPIFLQNDGFYAFYMFAGINILLAVFVWFFVPETKKVKLEEIDTLFGGANHVDKGASLVNITSHEPGVGGHGSVVDVDEVGAAYKKTSTHTEIAKV